jgi:Uma2 family endonuclease
MQAGTLVSIDEYLHTPYDPDCDYVDGVLEERNLGETSHATLQLLIGSYLLRQKPLSGIHVMTEARMQTRPTRFRVPDITVTDGKPRERVLTVPPLLCIEILSPEDRLSRIRSRAQEYIEMGVPEIWIIDPETLQAYRCNSDGLHEIRERVLITADGRVRLDLDAIEQDLRA